MVQGFPGPTVPDVDSGKVSAEQPKNPLHGITLATIVEDLVARRGWADLASRINIRCFAFEPSVKSSLTFLRKTEWARRQVEQLYLDDHRELDTRPDHELIADGEDDMTDATLRRLRDSLPAGWTMSLTAIDLRLTRELPAWILFENQINAMMSRETDEQRAQRIKTHGKQVTPYVSYRVEPRWSDTKIADALAQNASAAEQLATLAQAVEHMRDKRFEKHRPSYAPKNPTDEEELRVYEAARAQLETRLIELPVCRTETLSIFPGTELGAADDMHIVHPREASREVYAVRQRVRELCE